MSAPVLNSRHTQMLRIKTRDLGFSFPGRSPKDSLKVKERQTRAELYAATSTLHRLSSHP